MDDLLAVRRALAGTAVPVLVLGKGSNLLVADAGFVGLAVRLGPGLGGIETAGGRAGRRAGGGSAGGGAGLPVLARRTVEAGLTGLEWAVGVPGSVGGAVRMNAGGHGADTASRLLRYRWVDLARRARRRGHARPARPSATAPPRWPPARWWWGRPSGCAGGTPTRAGRRWARSSAGGASTSPGAPTPGRSSPTPRRLGRPAGGGGRAEGVPPGHGPGFGEARQLHPGRRRGVGRRREAAHRPRARRRFRAVRGGARTEVRLVGFDAADNGVEPGGQARRAPSGEGG